MPKIFYPTSEKLSFLLQSIHNREVALPDFQRDFVWDPRATEELLESICQNFPAGSLLRIKNSKDFYFVPREFTGAPALDGHEPSYLVLDGQQRLTSLYQALYGTGNHRYFVDLKGLVEKKDLEDCVFYLRKSEAKNKYGTIAQQAVEFTFPLERLFGDQAGFEEWLDSVLAARTGQGEDKDALKQSLRAVRKQWLKNMEDYEFPMVTLAENTSANAVCTIFETLNRTGVKLSVFDLLAARFWPVDIRLRDLWQKAKNDHPIIPEFDIDPYYILQAVSIYASRLAPSCKRGDVLKMEVGQIKEGWEHVICGVAKMLHILRNDCGVVLPQWLPYNTILIPAAAVLAKTKDQTGPAVAASLNKLKRWFWCSVFSQSYEKAPNAQSVKDYNEILKWFDGGAPPQTVAEFSFDPNSLKETTYRQRAVYRGIIALILRNGARDFHNGERITASMVLEGKMDDHHIFPKGFLGETYPAEINGTLRDCILNRTLIDKETNQRIGMRAPSDYLREISDIVGADHIEVILGSHLLPGRVDSPLWQDRFEDFIAVRQEMIYRQIEEVTK